MQLKRKIIVFLCFLVSCANAYPVRLLAYDQANASCVSQELPWEIIIGGEPGDRYYENQQYETDWNCPTLVVGEERVRIIEDEELDADGRSLKIDLPPGMIGSDTSQGGQVQIRSTLAKGYDTIYGTFKLRFDESFDFVSGGKVGIGFCGGCCPTGGQGTSCGWSVRSAFWGDGRLDLYVYHYGQAGVYGEHFPFGRPLRPGQTYVIEIFVRLDDPGESNGEAKVWVDYAEVLHLQDMCFRNTVGKEAQQVLLTVFFGGDTRERYAPKKTETLYIGDIAFDENRPAAMENKTEETAASKAAQNNKEDEDNSIGGCFINTFSDLIDPL